MDEKKDKDGKTKKSGSTELKASGLYPAALGESIVLAWLARFAPDAKPCLLERKHPLPSLASDVSLAVLSPAVDAAARPAKKWEDLSNDEIGAPFGEEPEADDPWGESELSAPSKKPAARSKAKSAKPKAKSKAKTKKVCAMKAMKKPSATPSGATLSLPNGLEEDDPWAGC